jgi:Ca2+-transporting ATPase
LEKLKIKIDNPGLQTMEGEELTKIPVEELAKRVKEVILFARGDPEQKLKIVQALKDQGEVVAMMGDGVNDAPALKIADIGIVVGEASDVARETADMVLLDSNFATIVAAIEEGRSIFENIKKVVLYLLSDSFAEVILIGGSLLLGLPLPVTAAQILWVNLIEDSLPGVALAFEPSEKEVMSEPPRDEKAPIIDFELKILIFVIGILTDVILLGLFVFLLQGFLHLHFIQTVIFVALGIDSLFYVFACRSFRKTIFHKSILTNKPLILSVGIGLVVLLAAVYLPFLQTLLRTHPLGLREWVFLSGLGIFNLLAIEITKWVFLVRHKRV